MAFFDSLDEKIASALKLVPSSTLSELVDQPDLAASITKLRLIEASALVIKEFANAFSTYALLNIISHPWNYGLSIGLEGLAEATLEGTERDFRRDILDAVRSKLVDLTPLMPLINIEMQERGHRRAYHWTLWYEVRDSESRKIGIDKALTLLRPVLQTVSALQNIPYALIGLPLSYLLIPFFSRVGLEREKLSNKMSLVIDGLDRAEFYGAKLLLNGLKALDNRLVKIGKFNDYKGVFYNKIPEFGFFFSSLFIKTESFGFYRLLNQLYSSPLDYINIKIREVDNDASIGAITSMHDIMSGNPYFLTDTSWNRYRIEKLNSMDFSCHAELKPGISVNNFQTLIPDKSKERYTLPISFTAKPGQVVYLRGKSGQGKSVTTGLGLAGLVRTIGAFCITDKNGESKFLESLERGEIRERIWYVSQSRGFDEQRVVDVYQRRSIEGYLNKQGKEYTELNENETLMLSIPDAMLERELYLMAKELKKKGRNSLYGYDCLDGKKISLEGNFPIFPLEMFDQIYSFRESRITQIEKLLREKGENFAQLKANEPIGYLSTGMKARFMWEMHAELYGDSQASEKTRMIIVDEPFGNLDEKNASEYLTLINDMTDRQNPPIIILISHTRDRLIREALGSKIIEAYI